MKDHTASWHGENILHWKVHQSVHYSVIFCDKTDFINFLEDYNKYRAENFTAY